jgi:hypothetical protein
VALQEGYPFWDFEFAGRAKFYPAVGLLLIAAVALGWNFRKRNEPATEACFLFWIGTGIAGWFGHLMPVALVYYSYRWEPYGVLPQAVAPAISTAIGAGHDHERDHQGQGIAPEAHRGGPPGPPQPTHRGPMMPRMVPPPMLMDLQGIK